MRAMSFIPQNDRGPLPDDRISLLEHWCEVVGWMCREYEDDYAAGEFSKCQSVATQREVSQNPYARMQKPTPADQ